MGGRVYIKHVQVDWSAEAKGKVVDWELQKLRWGKPSSASRIRRLLISHIFIFIIILTATTTTIATTMLFRRRRRSPLSHLLDIDNLHIRGDEELRLPVFTKMMTVVKMMMVCDDVFDEDDVWIVNTWSDCAGMITIATLVITIVSENPASPQVRILIHIAVVIWKTMIMTKPCRCHHPKNKPCKCHHPDDFDEGERVLSGDRGGNRDYLLRWRERVFEGFFSHLMMLMILNQTQAKGWRQRWQ